jgi:hypothetical protein
MPLGYNLHDGTVYKGNLVNVPPRIAEKAREETARYRTNTAYYENLAKKQREEERARRVRKQSELFEKYGTRDVKEEVSDEKQQIRLTELRQSRGKFAAATHEERKKTEAEAARREEADNWRRDWSIRRADKKVARTAARTAAITTRGQGGGFRHKKPSVPQSKEILGKIRRIYKVAGSRKEHVKYKGQLIPVSDYKKLMILKR